MASKLLPAPPTADGDASGAFLSLKKAALILDGSRFASKKPGLFLLLFLLRSQSARIVIATACDRLERSR